MEIRKIRELKQRRRRRRRRRLVKSKFVFHQQNSQLSRLIRFANGFKNMLKLNMQRRRSVSNGNTKNLKRRRTWSFHVVVLYRTVNKCTKNYNARAQLLLCSLNLLFGDVLAAVVVVIWLSSQVTIVFHVP